MFTNRKVQAYLWCADVEDTEYVIAQVQKHSLTWDGVRWPWYSCCEINPIPTDPELTFRCGPEVFGTKSSLLAQLKYHNQEVKRLTLELNSPN